MKIKKMVIFILMAVFSLCVVAKTTEVRGVGTVSYDYWVGQADKNKAVEQAQVDAIRRYFAQGSQAESKNFQAIEPRVLANLDQYILNSTVIDEKDQKDFKKYTVVLDVEIDADKINTDLVNASAVSKVSATQRSPLVYIFVGRQVASLKKFDARVFKRSDAAVSAKESSNQSHKGKEGESIKKNAITTTSFEKEAGDLQESTIATSETGGSTTQKVNESSYRLLPLANVQTSITSVFSQGNFDVVDPDFVVEDSVMSALKQEYAKGDDLTPATMRSLVGDLRKNQVPYLVLATLDVGIPNQNAATGLPAVAVTVTVRVLNVAGAFPKEIASIPAVQYFGTGPDASSATAQALKQASLAAAKEVVSRLNAADVS